MAGFFFLTSSYTYVPEVKMNETNTLEVEMNFEDYVSFFYNKLSPNYTKPEFGVFKQAITGFFVLKAKEKVRNNLLTIIDFSLSGNDERMWIIDMDKMKIVHLSLVSHGKNSGELYANKFSNITSSYQSSLGFYTTGDIYTGKHGMSLYLDGVERGINDNARERAIVIHSADYVSKDFIAKNGRLGRSQGCPAIPVEYHKKVISLISGGSCLYIYHPQETYHSNTEMLGQEIALAGMIKFFDELPGILAVVPALPSSENPI